MLSPDPNPQPPNPNPQPSILNPKPQTLNPQPPDPPPGRSPALGLGRSPALANSTSARKLGQACGLRMQAITPTEDPPRPSPRPLTRAGQIKVNVNVSAEARASAASRCLARDLPARRGARRFYLISHNGFGKSTPPQNCELTVYYGYVDDFVGELTFQNHLIHTLCEMISYRKCLSSRFIQVNSPTNPSTYPLLLLI